MLLQYACWGTSYYLLSKMHHFSSTLKMVPDSMDIMKRSYALSLLFLIIISVGALQAQSGLKVRSNTPKEFGQHIKMHSSILGEDRTMNILLPESFYEASEDHVYPVLFIDGAHGDQFFSTVGGMVRHLSSVSRMPETIVISFHNSKTYAPNVYTNGMWSARDKLEFNADPDKFAAYLEKELFPYLKENFRATDYRMIMGVSGSSLFSLHTFAKIPDLFDAQMVFAAADMIGMGYEPGTTFIDAFGERMSKSPNSKGQLYVSVSDNDILGDSHDGAYQRNLDALKSKLQPYASKNLRLKVEIVPNEGHYDYILKGLLSALDMIFPKEEWSPKFRDMIKEPGDAMDNIDAYHQKLTTEYGFAILPKAERWNSVNCLRFIGGKLLQDGRIKESVKVFERRVMYRPRSVAALTSLAEALEADGQSVRAEEMREKAALLDQTESSTAADEEEHLSKEALQEIFKKYKAAQDKVFSKGSTVEGANALFDFYTPDFEYNHPKYGGIYSRELLYNNTVKYLQSGGYDDERERKVLKTIIGLDAIVVEQQYVGDDKTTMTLIKFKGDKICYIEEYW